jgi:hypothetical protein
MSKPTQPELPLFDAAPPLPQSEPPVVNAAPTPAPPSEPEPMPEPTAPATPPAPLSEIPNPKSEIAPSSRALVVSIHDVSPHTFPAVQQIVAALEEIGVSAMSLLVVADHHRRGHIFDDPAFCQWLQQRAAKGDEIVMHGYHHVRDQHPHESLADKITTRLYTKHEGEFYDIGGADALRIVNEARLEFRKLGLNPRGFIAPAWLLSAGASVALRTLGMEYTTRLRTVEDLAFGRVYESQSLCWSIRAGWRRLLSRLWNPSLYRKLKVNPLLRIAIHPPDIQHPAVWRQIIQLTTLSLADRIPVTYLRWVQARRASKAP